MPTASSNVTAIYARCGLCKERLPTCAFAVKDRRTGRIDTACYVCRAERRRSGLQPHRNTVRIDAPIKVCNLCAEKKPRSEFYPKTGGRPGEVISHCKTCSSAQSNARNKVAIRQNWAERLLKYARCNRLKRGAVHDRCDFNQSHLFELFAAQMGRCYWTGVELSLDSMGQPWSVSLDRLDNSKGYLKGNVVLATRGANLARNSALPDEFQAFIKMIKES